MFNVTDVAMSHPIYLYIPIQPTKKPTTQWDPSLAGGRLLILHAALLNEVRLRRGL